MSDNGAGVQSSELFEKLAVFEAFLKEFEPNVEKITKEINPNIVALRERYETDNTMVFLKKAGDNLPIFIELLDYMNAAHGMIKDFAPAIDSITKEITPNLKLLRESLEKDETLRVIQKIGENMGLMASVLDEFSNPDSKLRKITNAMAMTYNSISEGEVERFGAAIPTIVDILTHATSPEVLTTTSGMVDTIVTCQRQYNQDGPRRIGMFNYVSVMRDPDIQMAIGFLTNLLKNFNICIEGAYQETKQLQIEPEAVESAPSEITMPVETREK